MASLLYRSVRGYFAYSDAYQAHAEIELPEDLRSKAASNKKRKAALMQIAFKLAEDYLKENSIEKPAELTAQEAKL